MYVLILEDDELVGDLLETVVASAYPGARIRLFTLLQSALSSWAQQPADLVITDRNLPDGSGLELIRAVRKTSGSLGYWRLHQQTVPRRCAAPATDRAGAGFVRSW